MGGFTSSMPEKALARLALIVMFSANWLLWGLFLEGPAARAQDGWNPFAEADARRQRKTGRPVTDSNGGRRLAPMDGIDNFRTRPPFASQTRPQPYTNGSRHNGSDAYGANPNANAGNLQIGTDQHTAPGVYRPFQGGATGGVERGQLTPLAPAPSAPANLPAANKNTIETRRPGDLPLNPRNGAKASTAPRDPFDPSRSTNIRRRQPPRTAPGVAGRTSLSPPTRQRPQRVALARPATAPIAGSAWQDLTLSAGENVLAKMHLPVASPALSTLLHRVIETEPRDPALRPVQSALLFKAGLLNAAERTLKLATRQDHSSTPTTASNNDALVAALDGRLAIVVGATKHGCRLIKTAVADKQKLPKRIRGEVIVLAGYCAANSGNRKAAALAAELAVAEGYRHDFQLSVLQAIATDRQVRTPPDRATSAIDGLLLSQLDHQDATVWSGALARGTPDLIAYAKESRVVPTVVRALAVERAVLANIIAPRALSDVYRTAAGADTTSRPPSGAAATTRIRANLFARAETTRAQFAKTRAIRGLLDNAKRDGLHLHVAVALSDIVARMPPTEEIGWFTETAIETLVAGEYYVEARRWIDYARANAPSGARFDHWYALLDIADPRLPRSERGRSLLILENTAIEGRFPAPVLHRLVTILDALDYNVPIPLWNKASATPQPKGGYLPPTGVLTTMGQAAKAGNAAAAILHAGLTLGPGGPRGANLIALGDLIRALKRVGHEDVARRVAFEALFDDWPRLSRF